MSRTKFGKSVDVDSPYAVYKAGDIEWRVLKTYQGVAKEKSNPYARWMVAAKSPMTYGSWDMGDTYAREVLKYGQLVVATDQWKEEYNNELT